MGKIIRHPILSMPEGNLHTFLFNGIQITGTEGLTIAAALHQNGYPVHSHSIKGRSRSLNCGIGKCGACEMLVDGQVKRICITPIDGIKSVSEITDRHLALSQCEPCASATTAATSSASAVHKTDVVIVGAGPAGLSCREALKSLGIDSIVVDSNDRIGGQFLMQTHAFFFFEKEKRFGGMRGFDIAKTLASDDTSNIFLNSTVWDILADKRIAVKNTVTNKIFYIEAQAMVVATGAVPFMPAFENDDLPGVYTAAVVQKMMNAEFTLLGKNVLTIGAGNIGYLTSYQLMQAGAKVKAILEAMPYQGGFPVQANRVRRLGIPIYTSQMLLKAIPNADGSGIIGAVICDCKDFKPIQGTEKVIKDIDTINICTGLIPDNQLLLKGQYVFGKRCFGAGDAVRIGEGTTAVLRGYQVAYELAQELGRRHDYNDYLTISKEYIESLQRPVKIRQQAAMPSKERASAKPFVRLQCLYGFACNPCSFACKQGAITKSSTSVAPEIDYQKCTGCMQCVSQCPGLAIFGYDLQNQKLFLPVEYGVNTGSEVYLVDDTGSVKGEGIIEKVLEKPTKTNVVRIKINDLKNEIVDITGFIIKENYPEKLSFEPISEIESNSYICHCEDISFDELIEAIGNRKFISIDEIKHITRLGMGSCRGKRCIPRLRLKLKEKGIELVGDSTPRAPLSTHVLLGEMYPKQGLSSTAASIETVAATSTYIITESREKRKTDVLIAGGGIAGSSLFRYFAEASKKVVLVNAQRGSSWRNIAGGRPAFSVPELAEIAKANQKIFEDIQREYNIQYRQTRYITFAHDESTYKDLERSCAWSNGRLIDKKDFCKEISPFFNKDQNTYYAAQISENCWQATPGRVVDFLRSKACERGGELLEDTPLVEVHKENNAYRVLLLTHEQKYVEYECEHFVNALGMEAEKFARMLGLETGLYPVKHQALITRRLPMLGKDGDILDMLIDRRKANNFSAVYGQQLAETGQLIACASPAIDSQAIVNNFDELKFNTVPFSQIISEVFCNWIPALSSAPIQATWAGYYIEPRYIIDTQNGLFVGLQGHGFMLSQYLAKMYVDEFLGKAVPSYMNRLRLSESGISEKSFK